MAESEQTLNPWMPAEQNPRIEIQTISDRQGKQPQQLNKLSDEKLGIGERAFSAAGAAFLSAIIVNPLDVVKVTRLSSLFISYLGTLFGSCESEVKKDTKFLGFTILLD